MLGNVRMQPITTWIIGINVFIFILMSISNILFVSPNPNVNMYTYIMIILSMYEGSPFFTILTSAFVHGSIFHLVTNMLALYIFGNYVEYMIGKKDFILLYFVSLLLSGIISVIYLNLFASNFSFVVGASGAIFGVWVFYSLLTYTLRDFVVFFMIYHALMFAISFNLAWYAHVGGVIGGVLFWFLYYNKKRKERGFVLWK